MAITNAEIKAAGERYKQRLRDEPHILKAHFNARLGRIIVSLSSGAWFAFCPEDAQGLQGATTTQLREIEISPMKFGLHFPALDAHFDITSMLRGSFGTPKWMAARLGAAGGSVKSKAKKTAAQANGKLGGRPRKDVAS